MNISGMNWKEAVYVHLIENRQKNMNGKLRQMLLKKFHNEYQKWEQQIMGDGYMDIHPIFEYEYRKPIFFLQYYCFHKGNWEIFLI